MASDLYHVADLQVRLRAVVHSIGLVVAAFVPVLVFALFVSAASSLLTVEIGPGSLSLTLLTSVVQYVGFGLAVFLYLWLRDDFELVGWSVPSLRDLGWTVLGFAGLFFAAVLLGLIIQALGVRPATNQVITQGQRNPTLFLYMIPVTVFLVGPGEELLFRGVVQGLFRRAYGSVLAVVFASVLFGAVHFVAMPADAGTVQVVAALAQAGSLGVVLGAIYERTENIVVPIVVHGAWNAMLFTVQWINAVYDLGALT